MIKSIKVIRVIKLLLDIAYLSTIALMAGHVFGGMLNALINKGLIKFMLIMLLTIAFITFFCGTALIPVKLFIQENDGLAFTVYSLAMASGYLLSDEEILKKIQRIFQSFFLLQTQISNHFLPFTL